MPTEITHNNLQPTIDLTMGVHGRDLGHVADDVARVVDDVRRASGQTGSWAPYDPDVRARKQPLKGAKIVLSGEYSRMQDTFRNLGFGLILAVAADLLPDGRRWSSRTSSPLVDHARPCRSCLVGVLPMLYLTGTAINVQSLLGVIFIVGIKVSNTVLMTDFAQELRAQEGLTPDARRSARRRRSACGR